SIELRMGTFLTSLDILEYSVLISSENAAIVRLLGGLTREDFMGLKVVLVVALLITPTSFAVAQITSATISGTIKDQTGGVLPGVDVVVKNLDTGLTRSVATDSNGYFTIPGLGPGKYEARATLQGFVAAAQTGIVLEVAQQAGLNLVLNVG